MSFGYKDKHPSHPPAPTPPTHTHTNTPAPLCDDIICEQSLNLILWLKVYVAFNDLHILKILSGVMWMKKKI